MDSKREVRDFLMSRRARLTPAEVGLPTSGVRRVPGLRRSEVAMLAGVSVEYYSRLERGEIGGASASVLEAVSTALGLNETERGHLQNLARAAHQQLTAIPARRQPPRPRALRLSLDWMLAAITDGVAYIRDTRQDILATNPLGRAFLSPVISSGGSTPNLARFQFLEPTARNFLPDWEDFAAKCVATMRAEAGRDPDDRALRDLVVELSNGSEVFRRLWANHDVRTHGTGRKRFRHPVVGEVTLSYEELDLTADPGRALLIYTAEPGSASAEKLALLSSWMQSAEDTGRITSPS